MIDHPRAGVLDADVARVEARTVSVPTGLKELVLPNGNRTPTHLTVVVVRLTDDDGAVGHSLLWVQQRRQAALLQAGLDYLAPVVVGATLDAQFRLPEALRAASAFVGTTGVCAFAGSGIEMALWDLACRRMELSLSAVVGRLHDRVPCYQTGLMLMATVEELVEEAEGIARSGIGAVKMLVGRATLEEDVERLAAVREALPAGAHLMVDALQRWEVDTAMRAAELFEPFDLVWIEDPIADWDVEGLGRLVREAPGSFATGETAFSPDQFDRILDAGAPYVIGELERVGGIRAWLDLARVVRSRSATMLSHVYPHVSAQLLATLDQGELWAEYVPWFDALLVDRLVFEGGDLVVPDRPGTGFDLDADAVERFAETPWLELGAR